MKSDIRGHVITFVRNMTKFSATDALICLPHGQVAVVVS